MRLGNTHVITCVVTMVGHKSKRPSCLGSSTTSKAPRMRAGKYRTASTWHQSAFFSGRGNRGEGHSAKKKQSLRLMVGELGRGPNEGRGTRLCTVQLELRCGTVWIREPICTSLVLHAPSFPRGHRPPNIKDSVSIETTLSGLSRPSLRRTSDLFNKQRPSTLPGGSAHSLVHSQSRCATCDACVSVYSADFSECFRWFFCSLQAPSVSI